MTEQRAILKRAIVLPALCSRVGLAEFHSVTVDMSAEGLRLRSTTLPRPDEAITCNVRGVGAIEVRVVWASACEFGVRVIGRDPPPGEVARRLIELARHQAQQTGEVRISRRIVPIRTGVQVTLADGTRVEAQIINVSASGVALRPGASFAVGEVITVGRRPATVVRQNEHGTGAAFLEALDDGPVSEHTVL